jgi:hypothetical protein
MSKPITRPNPAHARQARGDAVDVAPQHRRQVRVDDRGVGARDEADQRRGLVRGRHLDESRVAGDPGEPSLVLRVAVAVHQHDRDRPQAARVRAAQRPVRGGLVERPQDRPVGGDPLVDLRDLAMQQLGQHHVPVEQPGTVLVGDPGRVGEAAGDNEQQRFARALEQRVGGHGGAHLHRLDPVRGHRFARCQPEQPTDAFDGRVRVLLGVLRQQLRGDQRAVRPAAHHVGERAAAVDPELPAVGGGRGRTRVGHRDGSSGCAAPAHSQRISVLQS